MKLFMFNDYNRTTVKLENVKSTHMEVDYVPCESYNSDRRFYLIYLTISGAKENLKVVFSKKEDRDQEYNRLVAELELVENVL